MEERLRLEREDIPEVKRRLIEKQRINQICDDLNYGSKRILSQDFGALVGVGITQYKSMMKNDLSYILSLIQNGIPTETIARKLGTNSQRALKIFIEDKTGSPFDYVVSNIDEFIKNAEESSSNNLNPKLNLLSTSYLVDIPKYTEKQWKKIRSVSLKYGSVGRAIGELSDISNDSRVIGRAFSYEYGISFLNYARSFRSALSGEQYDVKTDKAKKAIEEDLKEPSLNCLYQKAVKKRMERRELEEIVVPKKQTHLEFILGPGEVDARMLKTHTGKNFDDRNMRDAVRYVISSIPVKGTPESIEKSIIDALNDLGAVKTELSNVPSIGAKKYYVVREYIMEKVMKDVPGVPLNNIRNT